MMDFYNSDRSTPGQTTQEISTVSGNLNYQNGSERHPFSAAFGGGYLWRQAGARTGDGFFENLHLLQNLVGAHWNLSVGDNVGYRKQTAATASSGESGTGEPIGQPNPNPPDQTVIALNTEIINNNLSGKYSHRITPGTTFTCGGGYNLVRYPNGDAIETDRYQGNSGIIWRLNARSSIQTIYDYGRYDYIGHDLAISTNAALAGFVHRWTPHFGASLSAGPQWVSSSNTLVEPGELTYQANAVVTYTLPRTSANLTYSHGFYGGSGFLLGSNIDTADATLMHEFRNRVIAEGLVGYRRTEKLDGSGLISSKLAGAQVSKQLGRRFSVYADYTAALQSNSANVSASALMGSWQRISIGAGFTPPAIQLGR
jgi:hypothetical protein